MLWFLFLLQRKNYSNWLLYFENIADWGYCTSSHNVPSIVYLNTDPEINISVNLDVKFIIYFIFSICLYFPSLSYSLTFKSDGTVIKSDGSYLNEPPFLKFQKALNLYLNGGQMPEDWPVVELDEEGNPKKVKGYFGEKILEEGAPLFSIPKSIGANVIQDLAL